MRANAFGLCVCLIASVAWPIEAQRQSQPIDAETFRQRLLDAFARGDRRAVAGMVRYRLVVDAGGLMVPIVDRATLQDPRIAPRGVELVLVNGKAVYRNGNLTGALPGVALRRK